MKPVCTRLTNSLLFTALSLVVTGCTPPASLDAGPSADSDGGSETEDDAGSDPADVVSEREPNDGVESAEQVNELAIGQTLSGVISSASDQDAFRVPTTALGFYRVHLELPAGSALQGHLTVLDDGRDDDAPGADYVQLSKTGAESDVNLELLASGDGHLVIVRDQRNLDGGAGSGSDEHRYQLRIEELAPSDVSAGELLFPSTLEGESLSHAGAAAVYRFEAAAWSNALMSLSTTGDMDGRLVVIAESTGGWIARNDDQAGSVDPLLDAPLTEGGVLWLVVDNVNPDATDLSFTLSVDVQ